jgi:hypothetical protein
MNVNVAAIAPEIYGGTSSLLLPAYQIFLYTYKLFIAKIFLYPLTKYFLYTYKLEQIRLF